MPKASLIYIRINGGSAVAVAQVLKTDRIDFVAYYMDRAIAKYEVARRDVGTAKRADILKAMSVALRRNFPDIVGTRKAFIVIIETGKKRLVIGRISSGIIIIHIEIFFSNEYGMAGTPANIIYFYHAARINNAV